MRYVDIGNEFSRRLVNRDKYQGDGNKTAIEFREKFLKELDNENIWKKNNDVIIELDFQNVDVLGPSFANEAFAYFTKYAKPEVIFQKIKFINITKIKKMIIEEELRTGYYETR